MHLLGEDASEDAKNSSESTGSAILHVPARQFYALKNA